MKRVRSDRTGGEPINKYKEYCGKAEKLYDIYATTPDHRETCNKEFGTAMTARELEYLEDQRKDRRMECDKGVDPTWYASMMKRQRQRERSDAYKQEMAERFMSVEIDSIGDIIGDDGSLLNSPCQLILFMNQSPGQPFLNQKQMQGCQSSIRK